MADLTAPTISRVPLPGETGPVVRLDSDSPYATRRERFGSADRARRRMLIIRHDDTIDELWERKSRGRTWELHREDGPARVTIWGEASGISRTRGSWMEEWHVNGVKHRLDGPAERIVDPDGSTIEEWCIDGKRHRDGAPAYMNHGVGYGNDDEWYQHGKLHRDGAPAVISDVFGRRHREAWYREGVLHRDGGPSEIVTYPDGRRVEVWHQNGLIHRDGAAALTLWRPDGTRVETFIERSMIRQTPQLPGRLIVSPDGTSAQRWIDPMPVDESFGGWYLPTGFTADEGASALWYPAEPPPEGHDSGWPRG